MDKQYFVYILANKNHNVLYVGMTGDLIKRVWQHKEKVVEGFTRKYNVDKLVYYEIHDTPTAAIEREKQLKAGPRKRKVDLINSMNSEWNDLYYDLL